MTAALAPDRFKRLIGGFAVGIVLASAMVAFHSRGDLDRTAFGDGLIYRYMARTLWEPLDAMDPAVRASGASVRYGRILLPAIVRAGSLGSEAAVPLVHVIVVILAAGMAAAASVALFPRGWPLSPLLPFLAPGFSVSVVGGYAEPLATALALWAARLAFAGHPVISGLSMAMAMLAKENVVFAAAGLAGFSLVRRDGRTATAMAAALVPVSVWYAVVAARYGYLPLMDPYLSEPPATVGAPVQSLWQSLTSPISAASLATTLIHIAMAVAAIAMIRRTAFAWLASAASVQIVFAAPFAWRYIGDAARLGTFIQVFTLLAVAAVVRPGWLGGNAIPISPRDPT